MAEKPQLLVIHEGVLRPAHLIRYDICQGRDLNVRSHSQLMDQIIRPDSLDLIASSCLGARNATNPSRVDVIQEREIEDLNHSRISELVEQASRLAQEYGASYFSLTTFTTDWPPGSLGQVQVHPTAQLYTPKTNLK